MRNRSRNLDTEGPLSIYDLDKFAGQLNQIGYLHLGNPGIRPLTKKLLEMANLQCLHLSWLRPDDYAPLLEMLAQLPKLLELEITVGNGEVFPEAIAQLSTLEELKIVAESFPAFPQAFGKLPKLKRLILWVNEWVGEGEHLAALGHLPMLEEVTVHTKRNLPKGLAHLKQMKKLMARGLQQDISGWASMYSLEDLELSYREEDTTVVADISRSIQLQALKRIKVETSGKIVFPDSWGALSELQEVNFWACNLSEVPEILATVPGLKRLHLGRNKFKELPAWMGKFDSLEYLGLSFNQLKSLPATFAGLRSLREINIDTNLLTEFPGALLDLSGLREISLYENKISTFPEGPLNFPELKEIVLSKNKLTQLPKALLSLPKAEIVVEGNPFVKSMGYKIDQLLRAVSKADHSPEARKTLLALAIGDVKLALESAKLPHLIAAMNDNDPKLWAFANDALTQFLPDPFASDTLLGSIRILGQTKAYPIADYKKLLQEKSISIDMGKPGDVDVVVISERPGSEVDAYLEAGAKPASVAQLAQFVESLTQPWLRTKAAAHPQVRENFLKLLDSGTAENIRIALQMITTGGMPEEAVSGVWAIMIAHPQPDIKEAAAKAIEIYASPALKAFLTANRRNFGAMSEEKFRSYMQLVMNSGLVAQRRFSKMIFACNPNFYDLFLPFMNGAEFAATIGKDGFFEMPRESENRFPAGILEVYGLEKFRWKEAKLKELPLEICKIRGLRHLDLGYNDLKSLPDEFSSLQELEVLNLAGNAFKAIPILLAELPQLRSLDFSENRLGKVDDFVARFQTLRELGLSKCGFTQFPLALLELTQLESLRLDIESYATKQITEIPREINKLKNLRHFSIHRQAIENLPNTMAELPLESLHLGGTNLVEVPDWFVQFKTLKTLDLSFSSVAKLPMQIGDMVSLERLVIKNTDITALPETFGRIPMLKKVAISGLVFEDFNATLEILTQLKNLQEIQCWPSKHNIEFLSQAAARLPHVHFLN